LTTPNGPIRFRTVSDRGPYTPPASTSRTCPWAKRSSRSARLLSRARRWEPRGIEIWNCQLKTERFIRCRNQILFDAPPEDAVCAAGGSYSFWLFIAKFRRSAGKRIVQESYDSNVLVNAFGFVLKIKLYIEDASALRSNPVKISGQGSKRSRGDVFPITTVPTMPLSLLVIWRRRPLQ
jgi:hypothetical protein